MSPIKLSDLLQIPIEEADMLFKKYAEAFPSLDSWLVSQAKFAVENLHSRSFAPCKRIRWYPELKEALNAARSLLPTTFSTIGQLPVGAFSPLNR